MLKNIHKTNPHADFLISDFSFLLESFKNNPKSVEINRPIISHKGSGSDEKTDYNSILDPELGTTDVFYQTDFDFLKLLVENVFKKEVIRRFL